IRTSPPLAGLEPGKQLSALRTFQTCKGCDIAGQTTPDQGSYARGRRRLPGLEPWEQSAGPFLVAAPSPGCVGVPPPPERRVPAVRGRFSRVARTETRGSLRPSGDQGRSSAPASGAAPAGRTSPSMSAAGKSVGLPASIAGESL